MYFFSFLPFHSSVSTKPSGQAKPKPKAKPKLRLMQVQLCNELISLPSQTYLTSKLLLLFGKAEYVFFGNCIYVCESHYSFCILNYICNFTDIVIFLPLIISRDK